jgi:hypothetical protein
MSKALRPAGAGSAARAYGDAMDRRRTGGSARRLVRLALLSALAVAALVLPGAAFAADSVSLTIDDPANGRATQIHAATSNAAPEQLFITYKKAGGSASCTPTASADKGTAISYTSPIPAGSNNVAIPYTFKVTGSYLFCSWLAPAAGDPATASAAQTISIRSLKTSVSISTSPGTPVVGSQATITVSGSTEISQVLFFKYRLQSQGGSCASTASPDRGVQLSGSGHTVSGAFSQQAKVTFSSAGAWVVCAWIADGGSSSPRAHAQSVLNVRNPNEQLSLSTDSQGAGTQAGSLVTVKAQGYSEFSRTLYLRTRIDDGKGCAHNPAADPGSPIGKATSVTGQFYKQLERPFSSGGSWLVCAWLASSEKDGHPLQVASTTAPIVGGPPLALQAAVRTGRTVLVRLRRTDVRSGESVIVRVKAPGWKGRTRRFTGHSAVLTIHFLLPVRPLKRVTISATRLSSGGAIVGKAGPVRPRRLS